MSLIKQDQNGFTLIELLVAVAIVGILAAIGIPYFAEYKAMARDANRLSMAKNVVTAMEGYFGDHLEYPPNPKGTSACSPVPTNVFYHEDCLAGIHQYISKDSMEENMKWSNVQDREEALTYYNYGGALGAVVKIQFEKMKRENPCSFTTGNWCNENFPTMETAYCMCTGTP